MLRYAISTLIAMVSLVVVVLIAAGVSRSQAMDDPFALYDPLAPGHPADALAEYPCSYASIPPDIAANVAYCQIRPENGPIRLIGITVIDDTILGLTFTIEGLQAGHLAQRWGHPDQIRSIRGISFLDWDEGISATVHTSGWFTYQAALTIVSLNNRDANSTLS